MDTYININMNIAESVWTKLKPLGKHLVQFDVQVTMNRDKVL